MNKPVDKSLRDLAQAYYQGWVSHDVYRRKRAQLLDRIADEEDVDKAAQVNPPPVASQPKADVPQRTRRTWIALSIASLLGVALLLWYVAPDLSTLGPLSMRNPVSDSPPEPAPALEEPHALVEAFLRANDWSMAGVAGFIQKWDGFTQEQRRATLSAPWFRPLIDALHERISEQQALAERAPNARPSEQENPLVSFAQYLGLEEESD